MNVVFFGTSRFSELVAEKIMESNHKIVAIVSQPDKVNGRNNKIIPSEMKKFAEKYSIPIYQFAKLNAEGEEILKNIKADIGVTASYGQIIKQNILAIRDIYNVHASLLPKYRGSAPIQWCLINGENKTGVTIMKTELGLDCGDMYLQKEIDIEPSDTAEILFEKLGVLGGDAIVEFLDNFNILKEKGVPQNEKEMTYFPMLNKEMSKIDFNKSSKEICNLIRGLAGSMTCYFMHNNMRYKVLFANVKEDIKNGIAGEILFANSKTGLIIKTSDSAIEIVTIQPEGKGVMKAKDYCNSGKFVVGDIIK